MGFRECSFWELCMIYHTFMPPTLIRVSLRNRTPGPPSPFLFSCVCASFFPPSITHAVRKMPVRKMLHRRKAGASQIRGREVGIFKFCISTLHPTTSPLRPFPPLLRKDPPSRAFFTWKNWSWRFSQHLTFRRKDVLKCTLTNHLILCFFSTFRWAHTFFLYKTISHWEPLKECALTVSCRALTL